MDKMRFDDALEILAKSNEKLYARLTTPIHSTDHLRVYEVVGGQHTYEKCDCQKCEFCAYWRLRELIWNFYEIRLNSRELNKHIEGLFG